MEIITSLENSKVKEWTKLAQRKYRDEANLFVIEGDHLITEALKNGLIKEIISANIELEFNITTHYVTTAIMKKISSQESPSEVIAICHKMEPSTIGNKVIALDAIQDPGNLGAIIRSAVAFNFDTIILGENTVDLYNPKTIRATEGMLFNISIIKKDLITTIDDLKKLNCKVFGTSLENGDDIANIEVNDKMIIVIGNEGQGINKDILAKCDQNIYIPINKSCESLNASIAASIIMYEINKR